MIFSLENIALGVAASFVTNGAVIMICFKLL